MSSSPSRAQFVLLRRALRRLCDCTGNVRTKAAIVAHEEAHAAWLSAFDENERCLVVEHARARSADIATFDEALIHYGTSLIRELQSAGVLE